MQRKRKITTTFLVEKAEQQIAKSGPKCFKPYAHSPLGKERGQWGGYTGGKVLLGEKNLDREYKAGLSVSEL